MKRDWSNDCPCHVCKPKPPREPGTPFGLNGVGEWKQPSKYFAEFAEERWERMLERKRKAEEDEQNDGAALGA